MQTIYQYLQKLEASTMFQCINFNKLYAKLDAGETIHAYCGYELSGPMHVGTFMTFALLLELSKFKQVKVTCLWANYHTLLNAKVEVPVLAEQMKQLVQVTNSNVNFVNNGNTDGYIYDASFQHTLQHVMTRINLNHIKKSLQFFKRTQLSALTVAELMYICAQIADIEYLNVDLAIGGKDQRRIHMTHNDRICKKSYLHVPLLRTSSGVKMSKSIADSCISMFTLTETKLKELHDFALFKTYIEVISNMSCIEYLHTLKLLKPE